MRNVLGWLGSAALSLCALPLLVSTIRAGHADGVDPLFLGLWLFGEIAMLCHVWKTGSLPLRLNYISNTVMVAIIGAYRL